MYVHKRNNVGISLNTLDIIAKIFKKNRLVEKNFLVI